MKIIWFDLHSMHEGEVSRLDRVRVRVSSAPVEPEATGMEFIPNAASGLAMVSSKSAFWVNWAGVIFVVANATS